MPRRRKIQAWRADFGLPGMSGIEGIRILRGRYPDLPMVVLTIYEDDRRIFDALCAGATGCLVKKTPPAELIEVLRIGRLCAQLSLHRHRDRLRHFSRRDAS